MIGSKKNYRVATEASAKERISTTYRSSDFDFWYAKESVNSRQRIEDFLKKKLPESKRLIESLSTNSENQI